ncbi:MAG: LytTR family transcriptional regulator DNA-binding domain-containing protein [Alistipes sp.]|nr:LytTR family transcriptional regulator DNA-binding domain-containing protein [Alistipes sp.]
MDDLTGKFAGYEDCMPKYIILTNTNEVVRVSPERIAYITSDGNYSSMVLTDEEKHIFSFNLSAFEKILEQQLDNEAQTLIRLGKRLIINERYIHYINISKQQITLSDISFPTKFTLKASKEALRILKATLEDSIKVTLNN